MLVFLYIIMMTSIIHTSSISIIQTAGNTVIFSCFIL